MYIYMYLWVPFIKSFDTDVGVLVRRWKSSIILTPHQQTDSILHLPLPVAEGGREGGREQGREGGREGGRKNRGEETEEEQQGRKEVKKNKVKEKEGRETGEQWRNVGRIAQSALLPYMYMYMNKSRTTTP